ncbi:CoA-binding protein [Leptospira congkakensis]|uniref:CoA-binding protein n=1 Tax=Leptospira congkakensis TaxID=2484932 RepID=A0A4Z1AIY7_9LEPT|nr:CoA-binding protein [Leptospira congkakensis]TGL88764.1 CoA-binding protein [Leptospira congkakensis]TGL89350.1 CoA-binding protein [Leptospira congkakensis]TGL97318.1 CoA-binding protein [Leptospira congkakensis]
MNVADSEIKSLLESYKKITVYGLSHDLSKPSHYVPAYIREKGWLVVGTYPKEHSVGGFTIYKSLKEVPREDRKFIDVFRSSDKIPEVIDEILSLGGTEVIWLQLGITHPEAEKKAEDAGIRVVSNRCLIIEHRNYF